MADQSSATSPSRQRHRSESGFGLIELLMATVVIAFVMVGFAMIFGSAARESTKAANRTSGQELATSEMEKVRRMPYAQVGTVGGNPPGVLQSVKTVGDFTVLTKVSYVNDTAPGTYTTYKDYKAVKITVIISQTGKTIAVQETKIAPENAPTNDRGVLKVNVVDQGTTMTVPNAKVTLTGDPGGARVDTTDNMGQIVFADLAPNPAPALQYRVTVSVPGYVTVASDTPPLPNAMVRVGPTAIQEMTIRIARPLGITLTLRNSSGGTLFTPTTPVSVIPADGITNATQSVSGGSYTGTTLGGLPVTPNSNYTFGAFQVFGGTYYFGKAVTYTAPADDSNASALKVPPIVMQPYSTSAAKPLPIVVKRGGVKVVGAIVKVTGGPLPIALSGITDINGQVLLAAPLGSGYTVSVTDPMNGLITPPVTQTFSVTSSGSSSMFVNI